MKKIFLFIFCSVVMYACSKSGESDNEPAMQMQSEMQMEMVKDTLPTLTGEFVDAAHPTSGTATINSERTELKLTSFKSTDGPILDLYLATDLNATDYISLGELQGLEGDFTYIIPNNVDFETHKYLMVWCVDFSIDFGHAVLE